MVKDDLLRRIKSNLPSLETLAKPKHARRHGDELQGAHPIHGGTSHSDSESNNFTVNVKQQVWHCFAHDSGGDIFNWVALKEGLVDCKDASEIHDIFGEVLRIAADRAGVEMDIEGKDMVRLKKEKKERERLYKGFDTAQKYFKENLKPEHREWVKENYGFDDDTIDEFGIGFAPDISNGLKSRLENELGEYAYSTGLLVRIGGEFRDFFRGRIVFPYKKRGKYSYFIARETPWTPDNDYEKAKYKKQLVGNNKQYVSNQVHNHIFGMDTIHGEDEVIVTEGITDAISMLDYGLPCISPITVRFKNQDIERIKKLTEGKNIYVCNDADEPGFEGALSTLEKVPNSHMIELDEGDLNDFYMDNSLDVFKEKMETALPRCEALAKYKDDIKYLFLPALKDIAQDPAKARSIYDPKKQDYKYYSLSTILKGIDDIKEAINIFKRTKSSHKRAPTAIEKTLRKEVITGVVRRYLEKKGQFLLDEELEDVYFFNESKHKVYNIESNGFASIIEEGYTVSKTTDTGKYLFNNLYNHGIQHGKKVDIHRYFYYDKSENKLYIHNRDDHYYVLDGETVEIKPNGSGEVFFKTQDTTEFEYIPKSERDTPSDVIGQMSDWKDEGNLLHQILVNRTNFTGKTALSAEQQRLQFLITLYMFPFGSRFPTKPILAFVGQKGSGKSLTMELLGKFLLGLDYDLAALPNEKDFMVSAYNNPLYFIDNLDKTKKWVNDAMASIATGVSLKERRLYTNFEMAEADINCFLGVNSRDPQFKRDDVVDRLLIFYVERLKENIDPEVIEEPIEEYWDELWSVYMDDLNKIIKSFGTTDTSSIRSSHRLIGWVVFAHVVSDALGIEDEDMAQLIEDMKYEKAAFSMQDDPLLPALRDFVESGLVDTDEWYSAKGLHEELCDANKIYDESYKSSQSLAKRLPHVQSELNEIMGMKQRYNKHSNRNEYKFPNQDEDILRKKVTKAIEKIEALSGSAPIDDIMDLVEDYTQDQVENKIEKLLDDGVIYESEYGKYKMT